MIRKKIKSILACILLAIMILNSTLLFGCGNDEVDPYQIEGTNTLSGLKNGNYYIWHDEDYEDIKDSIACEEERELDYYLYRAMYGNQANFDGKDAFSSKASSNRVLWFVEEEMDLIPTFYEGDELILYYTGTMPQSFMLERYLDAGYSFGWSSVQQLSISERFVYTFPDYSLRLTSDAFNKIQPLAANNEQIILDKLNGKEITDSNFTYAGTFFGLEKDETYTLDIYEGTVLKQIDVVADTHVMLSYETYEIYEYDFIQSNIITIELPKYLKTGYYLIDGYGMFRYIEEGDKYNEETNYNKPFVTTIPDETIQGSDEDTTVEHLWEGILSYTCLDTNEVKGDSTGKEFLENITNGQPVKTEDEIIIEDENYDNELTEDEQEIFDNYNTTTGYDFAQTYIPKGCELVNIIVHFTTANGTSYPNGVITSPSGIEINAELDSDYNKLIYVLQNPEEGLWKVEVFNMKDRDFHMTIDFIR